MLSKKILNQLETGGLDAQPIKINQKNLTDWLGFGPETVCINGFRRKLKQNVFQ